MTRSDESPEQPHVVEQHARERGGVEEFAGGEIKSYHGFVNYWLLAVFLTLAGWAVYYLFTYWGGLGPGLAR